MRKVMNDIVRAFIEGWNNQTLHKQCVHADKKLRKRMSERQIDSMVADSFPASDPPSTY